MLGSRDRSWSHLKSRGPSRPLVNLTSDGRAGQGRQPCSSGPRPGTESQKHTLRSGSPAWVSEVGGRRSEVGTRASTPAGPGGPHRSQCQPPGIHNSSLSGGEMKTGN